MYQKTILHLIALCLPFLAFAQNANSPTKVASAWSFHLKYGIPFFEDNHEPKFNRDETTSGVKLGTHLIAGGGYRFAMTEKVSLSLDFLYEFGKFSRQEQYRYLDSRARLKEGKRNERYQTQSFLHPIKVNFHSKRINFSVGAVSTFHFAAKVDAQVDYLILIK